MISKLFSNTRTLTPENGSSARALEFSNKLVAMLNALPKSQKGYSAMF